jgi:hypothetical protein
LTASTGKDTFGLKKIISGHLFAAGGRQQLPGPGLHDGRQGLLFGDVVDHDDERGGKEKFGLTMHYCAKIDLTMHL